MARGLDTWHREAVGELSDYLDLTDEQARDQWRQVIARVPRPRQEAFLPVETILAFALFFQVNPHSYGGANIASAPAEIHLLAAVSSRTAGSFTSKMLNLDGSRANAGQLEPEVYLRLSSELDLFLTLYQRVLDAARAVGISEDRLPDFLGVGRAARMTVLGQEELGDAEIDVLLDEQRGTVRSMMEAFAFTERQTTKLVEHRARLGQHRFARQVLGNYGHRCAFCGFAPHSLRHAGLLVASHIKPWRASSDRERLDPRNGVAACPVHDSAFDSGLLTVNGGFRIHRSAPLEASLAADSGTERYFGESVLGQRLLVPEHGAPTRAYLDYHHRHVFRGPLL